MRIQIQQAHDGSLAFIAKRGRSTRLNVAIRARGQGELKVTTPDTCQVVVGHIPYFVDADVAIDAALHPIITRLHVAYRFGSQQEMVPDHVRAQVAEVILETAAALVAEAPDRVGFTTHTENRAVREATRFLHECVVAEQGLIEDLSRAELDLTRAQARVAATTTALRDAKRLRSAAEVALEVQVAMSA